jgi:hypothetical protein
LVAVTRGQVALLAGLGGFVVGLGIGLALLAFLPCHCGV